MAEVKRHRRMLRAADVGLGPAGMVSAPAMMVMFATSDTSNQGVPGWSVAIVLGGLILTMVLAICSIVNDPRGKQQDGPSPVPFWVLILAWAPALASFLYSLVLGFGGIGSAAFAMQFCAVAVLPALAVVLHSVWWAWSHPERSTATTSG